jgi:hypothetical protein
MPGSDESSAESVWCGGRVAVKIFRAPDVANAKRRSVRARIQRRRSPLKRVSDISLAQPGSPVTTSPTISPAGFLSPKLQKVYNAMNMEIVKRGLAAALLLAGLSPIACGSDSKGSTSDNKDTNTGGSKGDDGTGGATTTTPHVDAGPPPPTGSVPCGSTNCVLPTGVTGTACCKDNFGSVCGMTSALGGCGDLPPETPAGCGMLPSTPFFSLIPCCTANGECGVDLTMLGLGCLNYADAKAKTAGMIPDGGTINGMMIPSFNIMLPAQANCTGK